ncbi:hypothetical protein BS78_03G364500 [Paspalum vaginatum]|nr:hypothetical protein BS78_03G364500 [Paspalum vaginatum]
MISCLASGGFCFAWINRENYSSSSSIFQSILTQVRTAKARGTCFYSMSEMAADTKFFIWLLLLSGSSLCFGSDPDVQCLKNVQQSVIDPNGILESSWIFDNPTDGFICQFTGVECWHPDENRVLTLRLSNLGLQGRFPQGLEKCTSLNGLNLSSNNFSGPIPSDIAWQLSFLTSLDLSYNDFSGEIPVGILNLTYLDTLNLQHNQLRGPILWLPVLPRLQLFNVADNQLSGPIPSYLQMFPPSSFAGNQGLCNRPLADCARRKLHRINDESSVGAAAGFVVGFVVAFYFSRCFIFSKRLRPYVFHIWIH